MPKRKTDPQFEKAAKLKGAEKALYLFYGDVEPKAFKLVEDVKLFLLNEFGRENPTIRKCEPSELLDWEEFTIEQWRERVERNLRMLFLKLAGAIENNNSELFRQIADVLDQHRMNQERVACTGHRGDLELRYPSRKPSHPLAAEIALWAHNTETVGGKMTYDVLRDHLLSFPNLPPNLRNMNMEQLKAFEVQVRRIAKQIGVRLDAMKRGPRQA